MNDLGKMIKYAAIPYGIAVSYFVKEGPAILEGNILKIQNIPPSSKFPIKVTVVAWQYGIKNKYQTAEPVERFFYINE